MNRLKELRQDKGLTQKEFAEDIGIPYRTIQRWENEKSQIKPEKAQQLADYFGVGVGYLLGYSEEQIQFENFLDKSGYREFEAYDKENDFIRIQMNEDYIENLRLTIIKNIISLVSSLEYEELEIVNSVTEGLYRSQSLLLHSKDNIERRNKIKERTEQLLTNTPDTQQKND